MTEIVSFSLGQLVAFTLVGIVLGGAATLWIVLGGRKSQQTKSQGGEGLASGPVPIVASSARTGLTPESLSYLSSCVTQRCTFPIDEAARLLDVSVRRVRRLLEGGSLQSAPSGGGSVRVTAISLYEFLVKQTITGAEVLTEKADEAVEEATTTVEGEELVVPRESEQKVDEQEQEGDGVLKIRQFYWYYVKGFDDPFPTLRKALEALGMPLDARSYRDWNGLPADVRAKISRKRITEQ